jgi:2-polyprenyl-3-methyl-5-hydroxy-6-metoxy-1,4-benzoquinol methylase
MDARARAQYDFISGVMSSGLSGLRVLDIGCGIGSLLKIFEQDGAIVTGFEPDVVISTAAKQRLSRSAHVQTALFWAEDWKGNHSTSFVCRMFWVFNRLTYELSQRSKTGSCDWKFQ